MSDAQERRNRRFHTSVSSAKVGDARSEARRDRDRILYSIEFQRLAGVTQVASPSERFPVHNRLTHSLKVSQVGRTIAERLLAMNQSIGLNQHLDPDVVEAACLAHDLGHPPFGHNTERALDEILWDVNHPDQSLLDGFEGNAQSFRIVTRLAVKHQVDSPIQGLNLTAATLNAILKYPQSPPDRTSDRPKWGYYMSEQPEFTFARSSAPQLPIGKPSLEADVMNTADDITYAVHDVEDFYRAGLLPLDAIASDSAEQEWFLHYSGLDAKRVRSFLDGIQFQRYQGSQANLAQLAEFRSSTVDRFIRGISLALTDNGPQLRIDEHISFEINTLKQLTRAYVIDSKAVQSQRYGQRGIVRTLFRIYLDEASRSAKSPSQRLSNLQIFPPLYQERLSLVSPDDVPGLKRLIADLISSMAETQIIDTFQKLTGHSQGSITDPLL